MRGLLLLALAMSLPIRQRIGDREIWLRWEPVPGAVSYQISDGGNNVVNVANDAACTVDWYSFGHASDVACTWIVAPNDQTASHETKRKTTWKIRVWNGVEYGPWRNEQDLTCITCNGFPCLGCPCDLYPGCP